jgi:hypothetical protein
VSGDRDRLVVTVSAENRIDGGPSRTDLVPAQSCGPQCYEIGCIAVCPQRLLEIAALLDLLRAKINILTAGLLRTKPG